MGTLSVRENLEFSAALRLPGHMTQSQRRERVGRVIETLGLLRSADTKVCERSCQLLACYYSKLTTHVE